MADIQWTLRLFAKLRELRQHEHWTRSQVEAHQSEALHRQRKYAYAHSRFYQQFHKGLFDRPLQELPVITKAMMMEHFDELVTDQDIQLEAVRAFASGDA